MGVNLSPTHLFIFDGFYYSGYLALKIAPGQLFFKLKHHGFLITCSGYDFFYNVDMCFDIYIDIDANVKINMNADIDSDVEIDTSIDAVLATALVSAK